ncbi:MAG: efflux RND transporter periplasmic adaptor subunit [Rhodanobacteraceae bacterium]|nr:MAG: efflux RND transporter periplasmic adaptor subunit [Rhodanobacteraceae bacterium]
MNRHHGSFHALRVAGCTGTLVAMVALAGCSSNDSALPPASATTPHNVTLTKEQQQNLKVITIAPSQYRTTLTTFGEVDFDHNRAAAVLAPFSGAVTKVLVTLGEHVKQGQPLADVASPDYAAAAGAYRQAVLAANAADAVAANDRALFAHQAISERENADAQAAAAGADAQRASALQALVALHMSPQAIAAIRAGNSAAGNVGVIRAPITGTVVDKSIAPGQTLASGTSPCFTIADTSRMWVMARIFGGDVAHVQTGDPATVELDDGGKSMAGKVTNVGAVINPDTRSVTARVSVDNTGDALKQHMFVSVHIASRDLLTGILVPVSAVLRNGQDLPFVYVVDHDGSYARRMLTLGARVGDRYVIPEGLHPGDEVVANGATFLHFIQTQ